MVNVAPMRGTHHGHPCGTHEVKRNDSVWPVFLVDGEGVSEQIVSECGHFFETQDGFSTEERDVGTMESRVKWVAFGLIALFVAGCANGPVPAHRTHPDGQAAFDYLKELEGRWVVQGGQEGPFGWEFDVTSRGSVVVERLKVGTDTEMTTVYHLDNGTLVGAHYCQLGNQPRLTAVDTDAEEDLHFVCDGDVASTGSHAELHMHGVHFEKDGERLSIWMDMLENGEVAFQTSYDLVRAISGSAPDAAK
jgi:hypothetical protein